MPNGWDLQLFRRTTTPLPASVGWYDATKLTGLAGGASILSFPDQSGAGFNLHQAGADPVPTYVAAGINGLPCAAFNGTSQYLAGAWANAGSPTPCTVIAVARPAVNNANQCIIAWDNSVSGDAFGPMLGSTGTVESYDGWSGAAINSAHAYTASAPLMVTITTDGVVNAEKVNLWVNGAQYITNQSSASLNERPTANGTLGAGWGTSGVAGRFFNGQIGEVLIFDHVLSAADRQTVENYLGQKWGLYASTGPSGPWNRVSLPTRVISDVEFELLEKGGYANASVKLDVPWEKYRLQGGERCDIYVAGTLRYRGYVFLPAGTLAHPESKRFDVFGTMVLGNSVKVLQRYAYNVDTDLSVFAQQLVTDYLLPAMPGIQVDIHTAGAKIRGVDTYAMSFNEAIQKLIDTNPNSCYWGFDVVTVSGALTDRFYFRPRAAAANPLQLSVGGHIVDTTVPSDFTQIATVVHITGSAADQPNLITNAYFNSPVSADEQHGNLVEDYSFEQSHETQTTNWAFQAGASAKSTTGPGGGIPGSRTGSDWVSLDQNTEDVRQGVQIDYTRPLIVSAWVRRGVPTTAATFNLQAIGMDTTGATAYQTFNLFTAQDPNALAGYDGNPENYQYVSAAVQFTDNRVFDVNIVITSNSGTNNNDGIFVDDVRISYSDDPPQNGWRETAADPYTRLVVGGGVHWNHRPGDDSHNIQPLKGTSCVKLWDSLLSGSNYIEMRSEQWAQVSLKPWRYYSIVFFVAAPSTFGLNVTIGCKQYDQNGDLFATYESASNPVPSNLTLLTDGKWYPVIYTLQTAQQQLSAEIFLRVHNQSETYVCGAMMVEGVVPVDVLDNNWWEGDAYERTYRCDSPDLAAGAPDPANQITAAAAQGIVNYGVKESIEQIDAVYNKATAQAAAIGYFNERAVPISHTTLHMEDYTALVDFTRQVAVRNIPNAPAQQWVARIHGQIKSTISINLDLDNEYPSLTLVLGEKTKQDLLRTQGRTTSARATGGTAQNSTGGFGTGAAGDSLVVHLAGAETLTGAKTVRPSSDAVALSLQRFSAGQASNLVTLLDETGATIGEVLPGGSLVVPTARASGLTGAVAAARWVGATATGHPTTGTFLAGDYVIDQSGTIWICTAAGTPGTWAAPGGLTNPMTTLDDLIVGGASGAPARLAKGTSGQVLTVDPTSGDVVWDTPAAAASGKTALAFSGTQNADGSWTLAGTGGATFINAFATSPTLTPSQGATFFLDGVFKKSAAACNAGWIFGPSDSAHYAVVHGSDGKLSVYYNITGGGTYTLIVSTTATITTDTAMHRIRVSVTTSSTGNQISAEIDGVISISCVDTHINLSSSTNIELGAFVDSSDSISVYGLVAM